MIMENEYYILNTDTQERVAFNNTQEIYEWLQDTINKTSEVMTGDIKVKNHPNTLFETSTDMEGMFSGCTNMNSIDISEMNVDGVKNIRFMFGECTSLENINMGNLTFEAIELAEGVFVNCNKLKTIDLSNWKTPNLKQMNSIFEGCSELEEINLSGFECENVLVINSMFANCFSLCTINGIEDLYMPLTQSAYSMFMNCHSLEGELNISNFNFNGISDIRGMFVGCSGLTTINMNNINTSAVKYFNNLFSGCINLKNITTNSELMTVSAVNMSRMFADCIELEEIIVNNQFETSSDLISIEGMFYNCQKLKTPDISSMNTTNVKDMSYMFYKCPKINLLNLSNFASITEDVKLTSMFDFCDRLTFSFCKVENVDILNDITGKPNPVFVVDDSELIALVPKDISGDTNVYIFNSITSLIDFIQERREEWVEIILSISKVVEHDIRNYNNMFRDCKNLETCKITITKNAMDNIRSLSGMFDGCEKITTLDLSTFNTTMTTSMSKMFRNCHSLKELHLGEQWNTKKLKYMDSMFSGCKKLNKLMLNTFDTFNARHADDAFFECGKDMIDTSEFKGYAKTMEDAERLNMSKNKPEYIVFNIGSLI